MTPSKSGCTFSPTTLSVTIAGANVTGNNFTASLQLASTLFSNGFESSTGWATAQVSGTAGAWTFVTSGTHPDRRPHGGSEFAKFNSYDAAERLADAHLSDDRLRHPRHGHHGHAEVLDVPRHRLLDRRRPRAGAGLHQRTWANVGTAINRYDGSTGWKQHTIDLTAYKGTTVQLGFLGISVFGNNVFIDDAVVTTP